MPIWITPSVDLQPSVTLVRWRIFRTETGESHFVGYCLENYEGRVSSAIQQFDPVSLRGVTESGRVYELSGPPGFDEDAMYVWGVWQRVIHVLSSADVTDELLAEVKDWQHRAGGLQNS